MAKVTIEVNVDYHEYGEAEGIPVLRETLKDGTLTKVNILKTDANLPDGRCIVGMYTDYEGIDRLITFTKDGRFLPSGKESKLDLLIATVNI